MVSFSSILFIGLSIGLSLLIPVILLVYMIKKYKISMKPVLIGVVIWIVFSQILEKMLHLFVMSTPLYGMTLAFSIYAAFAAGIFEETGRYVAFRFLLKKNHRWRDGIAYGIGHGGIEAILIGVVMNLNNIIYATMINSGVYDALVSAKLPAGLGEKVKETLISTSPYLFGLSGVERVFAVLLHIGMTMIVLYGIQKKKPIFLLYAILTHAAFDMIPALYQMKLITNLVAVEGVVVLMGIIAAIGVLKTKHLFFDEKTETENKPEVLRTPDAP